MKVVVIGASGVVGSAVADALAAKGHEVIRASRSSGDVRVDLTDASSIRAMFERVGRVGGVVNCAGIARMGSVTGLADEDWAASIDDKLMGNVRLLRFGVDHVEDGGVFVMTAGIWAQKPPAGAAAFAAMNGAVESLARAAARDLPRGIRVVTVSPPWIDESARKFGQRGQLTAAENAKAYVAAIEGRATGEVVYPS